MRITALVACLAVLSGCDSSRGTATGDAAVAADAPFTDAAADAPATDIAADAVVTDTAADAVVTDAAAAGTKVWSAAATRMLAENRGGGLAQPGPSGSECQIQQAIYTLEIADRKLTWRLCPTRNFDQPFRWVDGEKILTVDDLNVLVSALNEVAVSSATFCGADKATLALKITTPAGERQYVDEFYACAPLGTPVVNIDGVFDTLALLVR